ncbi:MAG: ABC transporter permease [Chloroflexi bacterium]|nr:ABC transporter permease [Chloroflexota bacterium]
MTEMTTMRADGLAGAQPRNRRRSVRVRSPFTLAVTVAVIVAFVLIGLFGPSIAPQDPNRLDLVGRLQPPAWQAAGSWNHPLGTDDLGRDTLSRLIYGARISLLAIGLTIPLATVIGSTAGLVAGWGGWTSRILMAAVDLQLALPGILFAVLLAAIWGPSLRNVVIVLVVFLWAGFARIVRSEAIALAERDFVTAARTLGASDLRIMGRHILPNLMNSIVILATLNVATVIIAEASLSFLGVGVDQDTISWGSMIAQGRNLLSIAWWLVTVPGIAIITVSLVGNIFGDWLRDALDPQLRNVR